MRSLLLALPLALLAGCCPDSIYSEDDEEYGYMPEQTVACSFSFMEMLGDKRVCTTETPYVASHEECETKKQDVIDLHAYFDEEIVLIDSCPEEQAVGYCEIDDPDLGQRVRFYFDFGQSDCAFHQMLCSAQISSVDERTQTATFACKEDGVWARQI